MNHAILTTKDALLVCVLIKYLSKDKNYD